MGYTTTGMRHSSSHSDLAPWVVEHIPWFRGQLLAWFKLNKRTFPWREGNRSAYEILVAEILLQHTPAERVTPIYSTFLMRYPSWTSLAQAPLEDLQNLIKSLGLWRQKAIVFQQLSHELENSRGSFPASRDELERLRGVGQYTASAVLTVVYGKDEPLIDVNMARVLERFFGIQKFTNIYNDPTLYTLSYQVVHGENGLQINWAVLDFSAIVCKRRRPLCRECPLKTKCQFFINTGG